MRKWIKWAVPIILSAYFVVMSIYAILRAHLMIFYNIPPVDLLIFNESLATTVQGTGFFYNHIEGVSHFGVHNSPILLFLLPIYKFWPSADLLIIVQTLAVTLGAIPVFKLAKRVLDDELKALAFMLLYLFSPFVLGVVRFDFHAVSLAIPFITLSMYYLEVGDYRKAFLASLIVLLAREDAGLFPMSIGLMLLAEDFRSKQKRLWSFLFLVSGVLWIALSVFVVIPYFSVFRFSGRYTGEILWDFVGFLLLVMLTTTGFLPLFAGRRVVVLILPFLELALSKYWAMIAIGDHYQWLLGPLLIVVSVYGAKNVRFQKLFWALILFAGISSIVFSPVIYSVVKSPYVLGTRIDAIFKLALETWS